MTPTPNKYYCGIGSRVVPPYITGEMTALAHDLCERGYILRSGNAHGSDQAFARGVYDDKAQIWLPWPDFNKTFQGQYPNHRYRLVGDECCPGEPDPEAWDSIDKFHPSPKSLSWEGRKFMARNYRQVKGWGEPDSKFVICWTHNGEYSGGTAQAMRIADHYQIPILNLAKLTADEVMKEIDKIELLFD